MLLLAAFLSFGWPPERTQWLPAGSACPAGLSEVRINPCCGSMRPTLQGGERAYVDPYHGQPILGYIISDDLKTHRVVAETAHAYRTSGDANRQSDPWRDKKHIRWVIRYVVRDR
jgi:hypothetical protein